MKRIYILFVVILALISILTWCARKATYRVVANKIENPVIGLTYIPQYDFGINVNYKIIMGGYYRSYDNTIISRIPKANTETIIFRANLYRFTHFAALSKDSTLCFVANDSYNNDVVLLLKDNKCLEIFKGHNIRSLSFSPDGKKIAFVATFSSGLPYGNTSGRLVIIDLDNLEIHVSGTIGFALLESPPNWLDENILVLVHEKDGAVLYSHQKDELHTIIAGYIRYLVVNDNVLIYQKEEEGKVYCSKIDGSNEKLLFECYWLEGPFVLSEDGKYMACQSSYMEDMSFLLKYKGDKKPGSSLFVVDLENKTYTWFYAPPNAGYAKFLSWYSDSSDFMQ